MATTVLQIYVKYNIEENTCHIDLFPSENYLVHDVIVELYYNEETSILLDLKIDLSENQTNT